MATAPESDTPRDQDQESPRWLGSVARRGLAQSHGAGWTESADEDAARPQWLGSVARREGSRTGGDGWVESDQVEQPKWLGSIARRGASPRSLVLIDMETAPAKQTGKETPEAPQAVESCSASAGSGTVPETSSKLAKLNDELDDRRQTRVVAGEIGMQLRVA
jgi:hypothetical protein